MADVFAEPYLPSPQSSGPHSCSKWVTEYPFSSVILIFSELSGPRMNRIFSYFRSVAFESGFSVATITGSKPTPVEGSSSPSALSRS